MNEFTTEVYSIISRTEDVFEFTPEHGLHGVAVDNTEDPDEDWFNPKLMHSLGYSDGRILSWKKIISPGDREKMKRSLMPTIIPVKSTSSIQKAFPFPCSILYRTRSL